MGGYLSITVKKGRNGAYWPGRSDGSETWVLGYRRVVLTGTAVSRGLLLVS